MFLAASFNGWKDQIPMVRSGCLGRFKAFNCSGFCLSTGLHVVCSWFCVDSTPHMSKDVLNVPSCYFVVKARIFGCAGASKRLMKG